MGQIDTSLIKKALYASNHDVNLALGTYEQYLNRFWNRFDTYNSHQNLHTTTPLSEPPGFRFFSIDVTPSITYILVINKANVITAIGTNNTLPTGFSK